MKFPYMRLDLRECLRALSDSDYQKECWLNKSCPEGIEYDDFAMSLHFLFDDTQIATNPQTHIGEFVRDVAEANALKALCCAVDEVLAEVGLRKSDAEYLASSKWPKVIEAAKLALLKFESK